MGNLSRRLTELEAEAAAIAARVDRDLDRAAELVAAGVTMPDLGTVDPADYLTEVGTWTPEQLDRAEAIMRAWGWQPEP
ncbi:MAG: hypothetical protein BWY79_00341 [Actinobacteria bacterium ADurb.Bin444]|mgnify:CR=1 FL=1|nr:MAG: hypothetical protein BWY79_00341 [Actinobacteria bacterium ADurb.Bin444]